MLYYSLHSNTKKGFSLVELLIVFSMIAVLSAVSITMYTQIKNKNNLEVSTTSIVQALRYAKMNAEQVNDDEKWGVYVTSDKVTVFKGNSYSNRDASSDQDLNLPGGVEVSGLDEVLFNKVSGIPEEEGAIILSNSDSTVTIVINEKGTVSY